MLPDRGPLQAAVLAGALLAGLVWSWGTWPDVIVDGGRELFVPWRIVEGDMLYRDLRTFNGPLSPYAQAAWMSVFGVSLRALAMQNFLIIIAVLALLHRLLTRLASARAALLACLTFIAVFAYAQLEYIGCANWMLPYSHEVTHGVALSLAMVWCGIKRLEGGGWKWSAAAGLCLGLVFLTKAEVFLAAACAATAMLLGAGLLRQLHWRDVAALAITALLPSLGSVLYFRLHMPLGEAIFNTAGTWPYVFHVEHRNNMFFKWCMGTLDTAYSLRQIGLALLVYAMLGAIALAATRWRDRRSAIVAATLTAGALVALIRLRVIYMVDFALPWQVFVGVAVLWATAAVWRQRRANVTSGDAAVLVGRLGLIVLAMALLAKILLFTRVWQYGFGLAMPATVVVLAAMWDWLPRALERRGLPTTPWRATVLAAWCVMIVYHLALSQHFFARKTFSVGEGADRFWSDRRGQYIEHARATLAVSMKPGDTLAVLPEGVMLNYLLRAAPPTRDTVFIVPVVTLFGEEALLAPLRANPPDWVALVHQDSAGYGARYFGRDYAQQIGQWVAQRYVFAAPIGAPPFQGPQFGIAIGKRRDLVDPPPPAAP
jgi:hypothetical protein